MMQLPRRLQPAHTGFDRLLVNVQTSAASKNVLHDRLLSPCAGGHRKVNQSAPRALAAARRQFGVRSDVQARLSRGLAAPRTVGLHPAQAKSIISRTRMYFHALRVSQSGMTTQSFDRGSVAGGKAAA